jgi:beta-lactamase class D
MSAVRRAATRMPTLGRAAWLALALLLASPAALAQAGAGQAGVAQAFSEFGRPGAWLVQRDGQAVEVLHGAQVAERRRVPASTIKPLLALVALETGELSGAGEQVPWNGRPYPGKSEWERDMALREAMATSSESYFGVLAERIGRERLAQWVAALDYGNGKVGDAPAMAWHDGVLTVTAAEQLDFVERLRRGELPIAPEHLAVVKAAMLEVDQPGLRIYGKTGTSLPEKGDGVGWWMGWVETPAGTASFVLEVELQDLDGREQRLQLAYRLMRESGLITQLPGA